MTFPVRKTTSLKQLISKNKKMQYTPHPLKKKNHILDVLQTTTTLTQHYVGSCYDNNFML